MALRWTEPQPFRTLDLDSENRPLSYWYDDHTSADLTAIAWGWIGEKRIHSAVQDDKPGSQRKMLERFIAAYDQADVVTAHNIRRHDLPIICAALAELKMPLLKPKLTSDTLRDLPKWKDLPRSQENLCEMLGIPAEKKHMSQANWREANRLTKLGVSKTRRRVRMDVIQHKALRAKLIELGWLGAPTMWRPR